MMPIQGPCIKIMRGCDPCQHLHQIPGKNRNTEDRPHGSPQRFGPVGICRSHIHQQTIKARSVQRAQHRSHVSGILQRIESSQPVQSLRDRPPNIRQRTNRKDPLRRLRIRQRTEEEFFSVADEFAERLLAGKFSREMEEQFVKLLEYYGQDPIIVRSSSILEDGFGNAFAGKYESVFCSNSGSMEQRVEELENAIRTVYASTMSKSALDYRSRRGLQERDEQMALLVQRVSGSYYGQYYMPCAAGVGYSYSPYKFLNDIDSSAGMLRLVMGLVMGLGTSAAKRSKNSF